MNYDRNIVIFIDYLKGIKIDDILIGVFSIVSTWKKFEKPSTLVIESIITSPSELKISKAWSSVSTPDSSVMLSLMLYLT